VQQAAILSLKTADVLWFTELKHMLSKVRELFIKVRELLKSPAMFVTQAFQCGDLGRISDAKFAAASERRGDQPLVALLSSRASDPSLKFQRL
jgi:hypothetical protein